MPLDIPRPPVGAEPAEPWRSFLRELDGLLKSSVELRCLGGFVITQQYGIGRETADIDFLAVIAQSPDDDIESLAGLGSRLHRKYRLYMQYVGIVTPPARYAARMNRMFPSSPWKQLSLFALDATDIALSKLERNADRDREDFIRLVRAGLIDRAIFRQRYVEELQPYLIGNLRWHDKTFDLWTEMAWPPVAVEPKNS
jgi:hypothetical protein